MQTIAYAFLPAFRLMVAAHGNIMKRVAIIGGGSTGWMTAAWLHAVLNAGGANRVAIEVIESPRIARIGVGEATVPSIRQFLSTIGIDEKSFLIAADATFKGAIKFDGWQGGDAPGYFHPFDRRALAVPDEAAQDWLTSDRGLPWADTVSALAHLCTDGYAPKAPGWPDYGSSFPYAYHMDADKFAQTLSAQAVRRGVTHTRDEITGAELDEDGYIKALHRLNGAPVTADLYLDCTGFAGVLIDKALGTGWVDYSPWLMCDRAIAMRVPHEVWYRGTIRPYTCATALSAGWAWDIGLINRRGIGYVYASAFIDDDAAERELRALEGAHAQGLDARRLRFAAGHRQQFWKGNCIALGMAAGFVEPLESTALYLVQAAAAALCDYFPDQGRPAALMAARFNASMTALFEEILDFINLHYCLSRRHDTAFWQEVQRAEHTTPRLRERLRLWRHKPVSARDFDETLRLFSPQSYEFILYGMGYTPRAAKTGPAARIPAQIQKIVTASKAKFGTHEHCLRSITGAEIAP